MQSHAKVWVRSLVVATLAGTLGWAQAADPVTEAMQLANAPYRMALFKTNGTSQSEALLALVQAQAAWDKLAQQFMTKVPAPYDRDAAFGASVAAVAKVYTQAQSEINASDLKAAHNTLEEARDIMSELRRRNQVVVFSDHMNTYHEVMEHVMVDGADTLAKPQGMQRLTMQAGALRHTADRLRTLAPEALTQNPEFMALLQAVQQSVAQLEEAVLAQDSTAAKAAIGKLKGPYSKLFAKFG